MAGDKVGATVEAITGIVKAVPVYEDVLQPAAREVGVALQTVAKAIHVALAPVSALIWGYDKIRDYVAQAMMERLKNVPPERLTTPSPTVAGPVLEALRFAGHDPTLREMYANLLATSLDAATAREAHPAYVEIIKQLTPDEARIVTLLASGSYFPVISLRGAMKDGTGQRDILRNFSLLAEQASCVHASLGQAYLDNICRLRLAEIRDLMLTDNKEYELLLQHPQTRAVSAAVLNDPEFLPEPVVDRQLIGVTALGAQFCRACVVLPSQGDSHSLGIL